MIYKQIQAIQIMFALGDEEIEALLGARGLKIPDIKCASGHKIDRLCCNGTCPSEAACCNEDQCENCEGRHTVCSFIDLKKLMKRAEGKFFLARKLAGDILRVQNELLNILNESRKMLIKRIREEDSELQDLSAIDNFLVNGDALQLKGKQVKEFLESLVEKRNQNRIQEHLQLFRKEGSDMVWRLIQLREKVLSQLISNHDQSKILSEDKQGWAKMEYLLKQLGKPSKLKLLFRASQHSFSAAKFHQFCDNIPNTITIVRTEFGKTIAAYTPLKWQATEKGVFVEDASQSSFLLQLELKEKMALIQGQASNAIQNSKYWGPLFGYDLAIADKCGQNRKSGAYFPSSYNCGGKYSRNQQQSYTALIGSTKGYQFRVLEYEVFEVIK